MVRFILLSKAPGRAAFRIQNKARESHTLPEAEMIGKYACVDKPHLGHVESRDGLWGRNGAVGRRLPASARFFLGSGNFLGTTITGGVLSFLATC